ncbi:helix-turn-helix domain-containing protein [Acinetobacter thermotolerans]|uniref:IclR family transcriptional regulator n=1 Tax=Acinetobacter thermotolerans TaxID=3151487 RepID=UPI00325AAFF4
MDEVNQTSGGIQSIDYISQILELFCEDAGTLSLKDIAQKLDDSPAKVFRYLVSLTRIGLLVKTEKNEYEIGQLALDLSFKALNVLDPIEEACSIARQIHYDTNYGVAVSVWGSMGPTVIKTFEPQESLYAKIRVGSVMSMHETSIGNTFAKYLPEHILKETLEYDALRHSGRKLNMKERLEFIHTIKKQKDQLTTFMIDRPITGLSSLSVPVFSISEEIQFVITVFQYTHVIAEEMDELKSYLLQQVERLSKSIGLK